MQAVAVVGRGGREARLVLQDVAGCNCGNGEVVRGSRDVGNVEVTTTSGRGRGGGGGAGGRLHGVGKAKCSSNSGGSISSVDRVWCKRRIAVGNGGTLRGLRTVVSPGMRFWSGNFGGLSSRTNWSGAGRAMNSSADFGLTWSRGPLVRPMGVVSWGSSTTAAALCLVCAILVWSQWSRKSKRTKADKISVSLNGSVEFQSDVGVRTGEAKLDAIVVGAGVAGAALAHTLGKDGRRVLLLERDLSEPDRIVGELLQPGGYLKLVELGLEDCLKGIDAQKVLGYALFKDGRDAKVGYPLEGMGDDVAGRSFHNGRFIQKMRAKAGSLPSVNVKQGTVLSLVEENGIVKGVRYKSSDSGAEVMEAFAPLTFVCDGCFSNLRRNLCTPQVDVPSCFVGLVLENCDLPHPSHGHVVLADPSPILFYPISGNEIRCLVDVPGQKVPSISNGDMAKYLVSYVAPQLPEKLRQSFIAAAESGKIRTMPNKSMPAIPRPTPGALLMGDAFNMRHPLTGGGMTVALSDILVLRDMLKPVRDFQNAPALCEYLKSFYTRRKPVASTINTLAGALYKVFCDSPDIAMKEMRQACFDYLSLGGVFSSGPVALLSGLNPRPLSLVTHFFAVAVFGVCRLMLPFPTPKSIWIGFRLIQGASKIIFPIILAEGVMQMFFPTMLPNYYSSPPGQ